MDRSLLAAEEAVREDQYNTAAWNELLRLSVRESLERRREIYEKYLTTFPTASIAWKQYIEIEIAHGAHDRVKELFKRCLMHVPQIGLWELYIKFLEDMKKPREEMLPALKLAVDTMKTDAESCNLWRKYIHLIKTEPMDGKRPHEQSRLTMETRALYQECIALPHRGVEKMWKEYLDWESGMNQAFATKFTKEKGPAHATARATAAKIDQLSRKLRKDLPSVPPELRTQEIAGQQHLWEQLLLFEKGNPLQLVHQHEIVERVFFVYRQYLLCFSKYPTVWYDAAMYLIDQTRAAQEKGDTKNAERWQVEATNMFERGKASCEDDLILHFVHADLLESQESDRLSDPTLVYVQFLKFCRRTEGVKAAREMFKHARADERSNHHIYTASAFMELCSGHGGAQISRKIFEKGMEKFHASPTYAEAFLTFMSYMGDSNNTRALFERFLAKIP
eukprot:gene5446-8900_t